MGEREKQAREFTNLSREYWDKLYSKTSPDEYCAEWPQLQSLLTSHLEFPSSSSQRPGSAGPPPPPQAVRSENVRILVPGCGNSRLSEHLYDAGFTNITNLDFSSVVISLMLNRNQRERPGMTWYVMDMTSMKFANETFDAIVDKGGLDGLMPMEPQLLGPRLGSLYLSKVKSLLNAGGKYICVTLAKPHVLALLFPKFRYGWRLRLYAIAHGPSSRNLNEQAFMMVAEKLGSTDFSQISLFPAEYFAQPQGYEFYETLKNEKSIRTRYSNASDIFYPLEDLILGAKANFTQLEPGRRVKLILGEFGVTRFFYDCILFDAQLDSGPFSDQFRVRVVQQDYHLECFLSKSEKQWVIVKLHKAARLLMVVKDSSHSNVSKKEILRDLTPLVKQLAPGDYDDEVKILFEDKPDGGIKKRQIVHQVTSALTGPIVVDDVIFNKARDLQFRRLTSQSLVQSEALKSGEVSIGISSEVEKKASSGVTKVNHNSLESSYHKAIISGIFLFSFHLKGLAKAMDSGFQLKAVVVGLRAGLLPMFMNQCLTFLKIEVVELDPVILDVARDYFDFREDERLKVHITDAIAFVREKLADSDAEGEGSSKVDILIVDVDSPNSTPGFTCPPAEFFEESFLLAVKNSLSEEGLFIINFISWSSAVKKTVYSRLKMVFKLYLFQPEDNIYEVIFALKTDSPINEDDLSKDCDTYSRLFESEIEEWTQRIIDLSTLIKPLDNEDSKFSLAETL